MGKYMVGGTVFLRHNVLFYCVSTIVSMGAQWLSGRVLDSIPRGSGFEAHQPHCVVSVCKTH